jgi:hypothetical protein
LYQKMHLPRSGGNSQEGGWQDTHHLASASSATQ